MINEKLKQLQGEVWVVGVSGGADSMALFDMCRRHNIQVIAAHMNYKKRDTADRDMETVQAYCEKYDLPCFIKVMVKKCDQNFQAFARIQRYDFYKDVISKTSAKGVMIAHHLDDHLETYIMQKQRHSVPEYYGIQETATIQGCLVKRILLNKTKDELIKYCKDHEVIYHDDESNFSDAYTRNKIRHTKIANMDLVNKHELNDEISRENDKLASIRMSVKVFYEAWDGNVTQLLQLSKDRQVFVIDHMIYEKCTVHVSNKEICSIIKQINEAKSWTRRITPAYDMYSSYGKLSIHEHEVVKYCYQMDQIEYFQTPYFTIAKQGETTEALTLYEDDFPITIRNAKESDYIMMRFGKKKVNRWFIDRKIPLYERRLWPVVENSKGEIILVPKIGCDIAHFSNNPEMFVIK